MMAVFLSFYVYNTLIFVDRERRNPRHPEVGRARAPDFANIRPKVENQLYKDYL